MAAIRLSDVALRAGVSQATASRVINGSQRRPAEEIAQRVRAAARELGYVANAQAQALVRSTTGLVGLIVHDIADPYFSTLASGVQAGSLAQGKLVLVASTRHRPEGELEAASAFASHRTDAIILAGSRGAPGDEHLRKALDSYTANGGRVVTIGTSRIDGARSLAVPNRQGAKELVTALMRQGLERFVILGGPGHLHTVQDREKGYREALAQRGLSPLLCLNGAFTRDGGYELARECHRMLISSGEPAMGSDVDGRAGGSGPICLLAGNDVMAIGAITALRELGLAVPGDIQVAGFGDIPTLNDYWPSLTTYRLPLSHMGEQAAQFALATEAPEQPMLQGQVLIRESAG